MRFSTLAAVAAATAPIAVSAKGKLGFSIGVRKAGQSIALIVDQDCY